MRPDYYTVTLAPGGTGQILTITPVTGGVAGTPYVYDIGTGSIPSAIYDALPLPVSNGCVA